LKDKYEDYASTWGTQDWLAFAGKHGYLITFLQPLPLTMISTVTDESTSMQEGFESHSENILHG